MNIFIIFKSLGYSSDQYCLSLYDVDECAMGLHNCSSYAICTNLPEGYTCQCPLGWEDGNLELPVLYIFFYKFLNACNKLKYIF
jgi:hypothetical protein